jgi:pimeloyl-ACP methyl ester carboxylesterase
MGSVIQTNAPSGRAYELGLSWGPTLRGVRWGSGDAVALFLHEPGEDRDLDAWGDVPARLATALGVSAIALDLPGHGLSDDPWEPSRLPEVIAALIEDSNPEHPTLIVAAGMTAIAALAAAAHLNLAGVTALSPPSIAHDVELPRSPATAKLFFAGAQSGDDLSVSRKLASSLGGWAVVNSIPAEASGAAMLATEWGLRLSEHIVGFARDILFRRQSAPLARLQARQVH